MIHPEQKQTGRTVFDEVRKSFATVAELATHVKINTDRIQRYAAELPDELPENLLDDDHHFHGTLDETLCYLLCLDSVNFGSGYKPLMAEEGWKLDKGSIYFTVAGRLKRRFEEIGPLHVASLKGMQPEDAARILGLDMTKPYSREFARLCAKAWQGLGREVQEKAGGSFSKYVKDMAPSAAAMVERLAAMEMFRDVHEYKGHRIAFYKRAQHNVTVLNLMFNRLVGVPLFDDIGEVTMFADNAVPRILHQAGVLEYSPELEARISRGEYLDAGSEEEIEIRACAGHAMELLAVAKGMKATDIDFMLWHQSVEKAAVKAFPSHRTLTCFY